MRDGEGRARARHGNGEEANLELGLSLGLISTRNGSPISSSSSTASSSPPSAADKNRDLGFSQRPSQVVGWPPVRAHWMNNVISLHSKDITRGTNNREKIINGFMQQKIDEQSSKIEQKGKRGVIGNSLFVKVNMDGMPIGRKLDLKSYRGYEDLSVALEDMFQRPYSMDRSSWIGKSAHLLDGSSGFILTYEDKDGDWMLAGDVPWEMFLGTVQRLRIMRATDVTGLGTGLLQRPLEFLRPANNRP